MQNLNYNFVESPLNTARIKGIDTASPVVMTMTEQSKCLRAEREEAEKWLLDTLAESRRIADEQGWIPIEELEREYGLI
ncbi:MAG: hypothetical protein FWG90_13790 [Oscillospiraceae bacterium]|nr:hypothetical protein [Oscillospiraceae bacterium]